MRSRTGSDVSREAAGRTRVLPTRSGTLGLTVVALWGVAAALSACSPAGGARILVDSASMVAAQDTEPDATTRAPDEIHTVHAPFGIPAGAPASNDLIFRHSYTVSTNDETKLADWVAYVVTREWLVDLTDPRRNYRTDPFLDEDETLEERGSTGDYEGAYAQYRYDRGHLVPLGSFHGSPFAEELNFLSVLAPQAAGLNRGPWKSLEYAVRRLVTHFGTAYVLAGPSYDGGEAMPLLPGADEPHTVPVGFWMIVYTDADAPQVCAFAVPQVLPLLYETEQFITTVDEIEEMTGLNFLSNLGDVIENSAEARAGTEWFATW